MQNQNPYINYFQEVVALPKGGMRIGAGAKPKPLFDKILEGNPGGRPIKVTSFNKNISDEMPKPSKMLSAKQADGKKFMAADIYKQTWEWLHERGVSHLVSPQLLERYAVSTARFWQIQDIINREGFTGVHPTTGNPCLSPYINASHGYMTECNTLWMAIFSIVKENCSSDYKGSNPHEDLMESILKGS